MIVLGERHLRRILKSYLAYYHCSRTHLGLAKDTPEPRAVQPPEMGDIVELLRWEVLTVATSDEQPRLSNLLNEPSAAIQPITLLGNISFYR